MNTMPEICIAAYHSDIDYNKDSIIQINSD